MREDAHRPRTWVLPPAPYAAALIGGWWLDLQVLPLPWGEIARLPAWIAGGLLVGSGVGLMLWAAVTLWRHDTTVNPYRGVSALCTTGPFRFSRNPIYLGDWLVLIGASLLLDTLWPLAFAPLVWLLARYGVIRHEEAHLEARFGVAYRNYRARVPRWW